MCTQGEVRAIVADMRARLEGLFPQQRIDAALDCADRRHPLWLLMRAETPEDGSRH